MKKAIVVGLLVCFVFWGGTSWAYGGTDDVKNLLAKKDYVAAIGAIRALLVDTWNKAPLTVQKCIFIDSAQGYGLYKQRANNMFKVQEKQIIYVEPVGYTFLKKDDMYRFGLLVGFSLYTDKGEKLLEKRGFGKFLWNSHRPNTEIYIRLWVRINGIKPGKYYFMLTISDIFSDKKAKVKLPFVIIK